MEGCQKTFVTRAGINVRYLEAGEGPAVLLVHGLATSKVTWYCNNRRLGFWRDTGFWP